MRMTVRYYLGFSGIGVLGLTLFDISTGLGTSITNGQWYLNPTNQSYMSTCPFATISQFFLKYFINRGRLCFYSKVGSNTTGTVSVGTADDPEYFETSGLITSTTQPTKLIVTQMLNSKSLNVWEPQFNLDFKVDPKVPYFVRSVDGNNNYFSYSNGAEQRISYACCAGIAYDGVVSTGAVIPIHDVYLELDIELCEFTSVFTTAPNLKTVGTRLKALEETLSKLESKTILMD